MSNTEPIPSRQDSTAPELDPPGLLDPEEARFYDRVYRYASDIIYQTALRLGNREIAESTSAYLISWDGNPSKAALSLLDSLQKGAGDMVLQQITEFKTAAKQRESQVRKLLTAALSPLRRFTDRLDS